MNDGSPGKRVNDRLYVHTLALTELGEDFRERVRCAEIMTFRIRNNAYNVIRFSLTGDAVSLLWYPDFFDDPFPQLVETWGADPSSGRVWHRSFAHHANPPILHRKELLLPTYHPKREVWGRLTEDLEAAGLLDEAWTVGYERQWSMRLELAGYRVEGSTLVSYSGSKAKNHQAAKIVVARHRTALARQGLSSPMQALERAGYLDGSRSVLDYGCGRGSDVRLLLAKGVDAAGWDPHFSPHADKRPSGIVNLGFVINVIEEPEERSKTLGEAFDLANDLLVVSAMLRDRDKLDWHTYADGLLTSRNTFQKFYTQVELAHYLEECLGIEPIAVRPGVFFVYKDKDEEQRYLERRFQRRPIVQTIGAHEPIGQPKRNARLYQENRDLLDAAWIQYLELARPPQEHEFSRWAELDALFGSLQRAWGFLRRLHGTQELDSAERRRRDDLTVYFALAHFEAGNGRQRLSPSVQRDVKCLFGSRRAAQVQGMELLYAAADPERIREACHMAARQGLGPLNREHDLVVHSSQVPMLPKLLRVYVGCGLQMYGDVESADLVKIHIGSGKLTLLSFDHFFGKPLPVLTERVKIQLRDQRVEFLGTRDSDASPCLFGKSRYLTDDMPNYEQQRRFDEDFDDLGLGRLVGAENRVQVVQERLANYGLAMSGFKLATTGKLPSLDLKCGKYLRFRDFVECGDTWRKTGLANIPVSPESYLALLRLANRVIDPVMDYFGGIELTYGFCSEALARRISSGIEPSVDQHACHETRRSGKPICSRGGAAVDFIVADESMLEVAQWITENTRFDRLYFYGDKLPLHVSVGPDDTKQVVIVNERLTRSGTRRCIPRVIDIASFQQLSQGDLKSLYEAPRRTPGSSYV